MHVLYTHMSMFISGKNVIEVHMNQTTADVITVIKMTILKTHTVTTNYPPQICKLVTPTFSLRVQTLTSQNDAYACKSYISDTRMVCKY